MKRQRRQHTAASPRGFLTVAEQLVRQLEREQKRPTKPTIRQPATSTTRVTPWLTGSPASASLQVVPVGYVCQLDTQCSVKHQTVTLGLVRGSSLPRPRQGRGCPLDPLERHHLIWVRAETRTHPFVCFINERGVATALRQETWLPLLYHDPPPATLWGEQAVLTPEWRVCAPLPTQDGGGGGEAVANLVHWAQERKMQLLWSVLCCLETGKESPQCLAEVGWVGPAHSRTAGVGGARPMAFTDSGLRTELGISDLLRIWDQSTDPHLQWLCSQPRRCLKPRPAKRTSGAARQRPTRGHLYSKKQKKQRVVVRQQQP